MKFAAGLALLAFSTLSFAVEDYINERVATRMVENGKLDMDRVMIFNVTYIRPGSVQGNSAGLCTFTATTVNNLSCKNEGGSAMWGGKGPWTNVDFCTTEYCGEEFTCRATEVSPGTTELTVMYPLNPGFQMHTFTVKRNRIGRSLVGYVGSMSKFSGIANKTVQASYQPLTSKAGTYADIPLGCSNLSVPVIQQ